MIQIFYGYGKGKTSALNGAAVRALGAGLKIGIWRFLKGRESSEDEVFLKKMGISVEKIHHTDKFVIQMSLAEKIETKKVILAGMEKIKAAAKDLDIIILDEFLDLHATTVDLIDEAEMTNFVLSISKNKEVFISGHTVIPSLFENADLITEFKKEKHYFDKGIQARKGIEF